MPRLLSRAVLGAVAGALLLAACGGGGGSAVSPSAPTPAASATPAVAAPVNIAGSVLDGSLGIAGAVVRIGTTFTGGTLGGVLASATSGADGSFAVAVPLATSLPALPPPIQPPAPYPPVPTPPPGTAATVFVQIDAPGYASLHRIVYLAAGAVVSGALALPRPTTDELAALAQLNADRARLGSGGGTAPLALDADLVLTARFVATAMATDGFYAHLYPGTSEAINVQYCAWPGFCGRYVSGPAENEDTGVASLLQAEADYVAEGPSGGHFAAIVEPRNLWVGFGEAFGGLCPDHVSRACTYFTEEFALTAP